MQENQDKYYTDLDKDLQNLAAMDWPAFVKLIGEDIIVSAKICILKKKGKSYNQISNRLRITYKTVEYRLKACECPAPAPPSN